MQSIWFTLAIKILRNYETVSHSLSVSWPLVVWICGINKHRRYFQCIVTVVTFALSLEPVVYIDWCKCWKCSRFWFLPVWILLKEFKLDFRIGLTQNFVNIFLVLAYLNYISLELERFREKGFLLKKILSMLKDAAEDSRWWQLNTYLLSQTQPSLYSILIHSSQCGVSRVFSELCTMQLWQGSTSWVERIGLLSVCFSLVLWQSACCSVRYPNTSALPKFYVILSSLLLIFLLGNVNLRIQDVRFSRFRAHLIAMG